jgi:hypothetical protein
MAETIDTLFICSSFFGYAREIRRQLESRGRHVALFEDRPATDSLTKVLIRLAPALVRAKAEAYFDDIIAKLKDQPIKDVLVIKGEALSPAAISRIRAAFPGARFTLYFWDSYRNMPADSPEKVALFDHVFTFDPEDAAADRRMRYRPLFFLGEYAERREVPQDIDVLFVGTVHTDRYAVLRRIAQSLPPDMHFEKVLYFPARWLYWVRSLAAPALLWADRRDLYFTPKTKNEIAELIARSRIVVDIVASHQSGYTMRAIEILGAGHKLITTNPEMANADFFNPANIAIVDRMAPRVPDAFLNAPYEPPPPEVLRRYSLEGWLDEVLPDAG